MIHVEKRLPTRRTTAPTLRATAPRDVPRRGVLGARPVSCPKPPNNADGNLDITVNQRQREMMMSRGRSFEDQLEEFAISYIKIAVMSTEDIIANAVVKVTDPGISGYNTVNDPRLGVIESKKVCNSCFKDTLECPGHFGYIPLNVPIYHPLYLKYIVKVLNIVCNSCGGLLLNKQSIIDKGFLRYTGAERLKVLEKESLKVQYCKRKFPGDANIIACSSNRNPEYISTRIKETGKIMFRLRGRDGKEGKEAEKPIEEVEIILNSISQEDAELMGFENGTHPRNFIMRAFPVIPPCTRPSYPMDGVESPDHLTLMYMDIISKNNEIPEEKNQLKKTELITALNSLISHFIDNSDKAYHQGQNREYKTIKQRIQGKKAYIRDALMGKRVNYSGRTVLSPDPSLKFGQIRVPRVMASTLTVPVTVTAFNLDSMNALLKNGKITHIFPGNKASKLYGSRISVDKQVINTYLLVVGDRVDRHLQDGDYVIFNRQPTLHKQSMMGYEVVLGDADTIGLRLEYTGPHNADFDGDEGNLHAPQTIEAITEVRELMSVKNCIMNAQNNKPSLGIVYDALTGAYLLTQPKVFVEESEFFNCLTTMSNTDALPTLEERVKKAKLPYAIEEPVTTRVPIIDIVDGVETPRLDPVRGVPLYREEPVYDEYPEQEIVTVIENGKQVKRSVSKINPETGEPIMIRKPRMVRKYSGRVLFSALLPEDFYYSKVINGNHVLIVNGVLVNGVIVKGNIGTDHGSIIQALWNDYGRDRTVDFLTDAPFIINRWLVERGFSVGLKDCYPTDNSHRKLLAQEITKVIMTVEAMGAPLKDPIEEERREKQVIGHVNVAKSIGSKISTEKLAPDNSLRIMAESGAKGSTYNIAQITGLLGQQFVREKRMPMSISGGTRCLPYFGRGEINPRARGFCIHSFLEGLSPDELFFHQAGSREGLMDTAVKTSETGSIHHRIIKLLEDVKVAYDGSVRNGVGTVFQFVYGEDGFNAAQLEKVKTKTGDMASFIDLKRVAGRLNAKYGFPQYDVIQGPKGNLAAESPEPEPEYFYEDETEEPEYGDYDGGE